MSYDYDNDIQIKLYKFQYLCSTIKTLWNTRKDIRLNFFVSFSWVQNQLFTSAKLYATQKILLYRITL